MRVYNRIMDLKLRQAVILNVLFSLCIKGMICGVFLEHGFWRRKQIKLMYQEFLSKLGYEKFKFMCYAKQCIFKVNF